MGKCLVKNEYIKLSEYGPMMVYLQKTYRLKHEWAQSLDEGYETCVRCHKIRPCHKAEYELETATNNNGD